MLTAILLAGTLAAHSAIGLGRTWTDSTGKSTIEAELVTVKNGHAYLEDAAERVRKVPLEKLSKADLQHLATLPEHRTAVASLLPPDAAGPQPAATASKRKYATIQSDVEVGSVRQFESPRWGYHGLAFSNDGAYLLALGNDHVTVIEINSSSAASFQIPGGASSPSCFAISPDGTKVLAGFFNGRVAIWRFERGRLTFESQLAIHDDKVESIEVSQDGKYAITAHSLDEACLWDMKTGKVLASYDDFHFHAADARFSRQGGQAVIADGTVAAAIDTKSGKLLQVMRLSKYASTAQCTAIANQGGYIAVGGGESVDVWQLRNGVRLPPLPVDDLQWSADFSPDDKRLVTGGSGVVSVWDLEAGSLEKEFTLGDSGYVQHVAFSPDGIHFAAIGGPIGKLVEVFRLPPKTGE